MKVAIHQPNYIPWLGFFSKIKNADIYVILDNVEYTKNGVINRDKIRTKDGWCYLTIPINKEYHSSKIFDVKLQKDNKWQKNHWKTIEANYRKSEYFDSYKDFFENLYNSNFKYLWEINENIIFYMLDCFDINVEIIKASDVNLEVTLHGDDLLVSALKSVGADVYLSGPSGRNYLELDKFKKNNIEVEFFEFKHPVYKQRYPGFVPNMAAIDLLFNLGEKARELI